MWVVDIHFDYFLQTNKSDEKKGRCCMHLKELKRVVDRTFDRLKSYQNPEEIEVLITLSEPA